MKTNWDKLVLGFKQGAQFEEACRRNKFNPALLKYLTAGDNLVWVRNVLLGMCDVLPLQGLVRSIDFESILAGPSTDISLGCKLGGELQDACRRNKFSLAMLELLSEGDNLGRIKKVLLRDSGVFPAKERIFDLDTPPADRQEGERNTWEFTLNGMKIDTHTPGGMFKWSPDRVELWQCKKQYCEGGATLESIIPELNFAGKKPLNASLAFHLKRKENKQLIPPDWKFDDDGEERDILFLNTKVRENSVFSREVSFFVYLCWHVDKVKECGIDSTDWLTVKMDASHHHKYGRHWYFACQKW